MFRLLLPLFCFLNLLILNRTDEHDVSNFEDNQAYSIYGLYRRFHSLSHNLKKYDSPTPLANGVQFDRFDIDSVLKILGGLSQNPSKCGKDFKFVLDSFRNSSNLWARRIIDSFGKPESGILEGNLMWVGDYDECINVHAPPEAPGSTVGNFYGQYCSLTYNLPNSMGSFTLGMCLPDSCSTEEIKEEVMYVIKKAGGFLGLGQPPTAVNKTNNVICVPKERHLNIGSIVVVTVLGIFFTLGFLGSSITVVKYFKRLLEQKKSSLINLSDKELMVTDQNGIPNGNGGSDDVILLQNDVTRRFLDKCVEFLSCFCVFTNGAKLLNTDSSKGQLLCIHGIRFFSMSWVILGHTYAFCFPVIRNMLEATDMMSDNFFFQVILQSFYSVDSFFVLSGFLLTYLTMKQFSERKGSSSWLYFYIHRFVRITPIYLIVLGFSASTFYYLGSGPFWPLDNYDPNCRKNWWMNLLYINNFGEVSEQCMNWSWYLANDMQFFIISPIFLITLWRWPKIGYTLVGLFLTACILSNFFITYHFDLVPGIAGFDSLKDLNNGEFMIKFAEFFKRLYIKPYTRIGPYLVGMLVGYFLHKHEVDNKRKLSYIELCIGWIVAFTVTLTCVYGLYHAQPSLFARSCYNALNRICFGLGLSWVIYVCLIKQGGFINRILSYKLFIPLSRLTYSAYLIHPLILMGYYSSLKTTFEFSHLSVVTLYLGFMVITYVLALPVCLILESPIAALETLIRKKLV